MPERNRLAVTTDPMNIRIVKGTVANSVYSHLNKMLNILGKEGPWVSDPLTSSSPVLGLEGYTTMPIHAGLGTELRVIFILGYHSAS